MNAKTLLHLLAILKLKSQFVYALVIASVAFGNGLAQVQLLDDLSELELLKVLGNLLHLLLVVALRLVEVDRHEGGLDVCGRGH